LSGRIHHPACQHGLADNRRHRTKLRNQAAGNGAIPRPEPWDRRSLMQPRPRAQLPVRTDAGRIGLAGLVGWPVAAGRAPGVWPIPYLQCGGTIRHRMGRIVTIEYGRWIRQTITISASGPTRRAETGNAEV
jgi:hypothetical protein